MEEEDGTPQTTAEIANIEPDTVPSTKDDAVEVKDVASDDAESIDPCRIQVKNIPKFLGHKAFRQLLEKTLSADSIGKIRLMQDTAYVNLTTAEKAQEAILKLEGMELKKFVLQCIQAPPEPRKGRDLPTLETARVKSARESVTPLADMSYEDQLKMKNKECLKLAKRLLNEFYAAKVEGMKNVSPHSLLNPIVPFPDSSSIYRNKCEFTIGKDLEGNTRVGFVGGRFARNEHYVLPIDDCPNLSPQTKAIVNEFTSFVEESGRSPFNEFTREGTWKMLTVREMSGDLLLMVTVFPFEDPEEEKKQMNAIIKRFHGMDTMDRGFRISSLYWQRQANASDEPIREHIAGSPYIFETLLGVRFRVSPDAFFQTNSAAATVLYETIGKLCQLEGDKTELPHSSQPIVNDEEEVPEKKAKIEHVENGEMEEIVEEKKEDNGMKNIILDICCGTGTIGQCIMKNVGEERASRTCCIGVELIESAVEDAKANARDNGIRENLCSYVAGKAEDTFRNLWRFVPKGFSLDSCYVVGILDPPRRGIHHKVVVGCRELPSLKRLLFVSCDPSAAMKNLTDLCRPRSNKFSGNAFTIEKITPVDMFPMTEHFEWVVTLIRQ